MNKNLKLIISLVISGVCLYLVFRHIDFGKLKRGWEEANHALLLLSVLVYMSSMFVRSYRWHFLLRPIKAVPTLRLFPPVIMGYAGNNLFPFRAGEIIRAYSSGKLENISRSASFATIIVERIFDGLTMAVLLSITLATIGSTAAEIPNQDFRTLYFVLWLGGAAFMGAFLLCLALIFQRDASLRLIERLFQFETSGISDRVLAVIHKFVTGLEMLRSGKDVLVVMLLSFAVWACEAGMYVLVGKALHLDTINVFQHLAVMAIINIVIMIPAAPGFAGTFDFAGKKTLGLFGIAPEIAVLYTTLIHLGQYLPTTLLGGFYMFKYNVSPSAAQEEEGEAVPLDEDEKTEGSPSSEAPASSGGQE